MLEKPETIKNDDLCGTLQQGAPPQAHPPGLLLGLDEGGVEGFLICDDEHGRYLAMSTDRARQQWHDAAYLHISIPDDGQVVIEWNSTEQDIGELLVAEGVRATDIVLSWG